MILKDKLTEAINAKNNDMSLYTWKYAKQPDGTQPEIRLIDATPEQLQGFYDHCKSMLYNEDKNNPGRYVLLDIIKEQRNKCNVELFLRKLGTGELCADGKPYPRYLYLQDIRAYMNMHKEEFPANELDNISIAAVTGGLPREFERISIEDAMSGCLDILGILNTKHITFSFILNMGVHLTKAEMQEFNEKDAEGNPRSKMEIVKERLGINPSVMLTVKPSGLSFSELRAMINLKSKKYSELTSDQLTVLRNKVLFRLENEIQYHIQQWETKIEQLKKVAESKGVTLK